jgi:hypothetical protein
LAARGGLGAFIAMIFDVLPPYASLGKQPPPEVLKALQWIAPVAGLAVAAALGIGMAKPSPRLRVMIGLTVFGLIHLLVQRKGWAYHVYPLGAGLACWGAFVLAALPPWRVWASLIVMALSLAWYVPSRVSQTDDDAPLRAASAMQSALERHLPRGARVQMLDSDSGAFLAMARAGMRQATPHIQWFSLLMTGESVRRQFLSAFDTDPPQAVLLTNDQWPKGSGFEATDGWPEFAAILRSRYDLTASGQESFILWRLYVRRAT